MNTADIGFEREIWKAADKMRGNIDASEYKSVVLGLIFLKYISDKFERNTGSLSPRAKDSRRTRTNIRPKTIFYVPTEARWERICGRGAHAPK